MDATYETACRSRFCQTPQPNDFKIVINDIIKRHAAPVIQSFRLYFDPTGVGDAVEKWIENLTTKGVE